VAFAGRPAMQHNTIRPMISAVLRIVISPGKVAEIVRLSSLLSIQFGLAMVLLARRASSSTISAEYFRLAATLVSNVTLFCRRSRPERVGFLWLAPLRWGDADAIDIAFHLKFQIPGRRRLDADGSSSQSDSTLPLPCVGLPFSRGEFTRRGGLQLRHWCLDYFGL